MELTIKEIFQLLKPNVQSVAKSTVLERVLLPLTDMTEEREKLIKFPHLLKQLIALLQDSSTAIAKDTSLALINIIADEAGAKTFLSISESSSKFGKYNYNLIHVSIRFIMDKESILADPCCMILANMTRPQHLADRIMTLIRTSCYTWDDIIKAFCSKQYNNVGGKLHYLSSVFCNLSQSRRMRKYLMDRDHKMIQKFLPFIDYPDSLVRRSGIVGIIKNCCFDVENHGWLLSPEIDILSYLLIPLAGPEKFDDKDNAKLPKGLQNLPETKQREPNADIRVMLLEAITQLCATRKSREILRKKNTYIILREYHKWEENDTALFICEDLVNILLRTEEEIGLDNIKKVEVPSKYKKKFNKMN
ncbi:protein HGH1 homolog [Frieseomelitta varia]|uniref:protein HGH1 homolog n=1 Tax=Frieseomelitta varia TaxID=561572 RepID=UPI001CB6A353|nr:protein HGH1 homolog [Frieseomelitta varia]